MDLAYFGIAQLEVFLLVLARTAGIFTLTPIFGNQTPAFVRISAALAVTLVFVPVCAPAGSAIPALDIFPMAALLVKEALVGLVIGFVVSIIFAAIQAAGDFIDLQSGFSYASIFDPTYGSQVAIAGRFHHLLAGLLFFVTNAHHIMLAGLAESFSILPVTQLSLNPAVSGGVMSLLTMFFTVALGIAAPVLAAVFLTDVALAIVARAVPQMNVLLVGLPLKLGVGLVGMVIALPVSIALTRNALGDIGNQTSGLLRVLALN